jgi:hypothetical protein
MQRTAEETAILLSLLFTRAKAKRARVSEKTVRHLSKRTRLRTVFLDKLREALDEIDLHFIELGRGGFGIIPISALDGAQAIMARQYLVEDLRKLKQGKKTFDDFRAEVTANEEEDEENEE